MAKNVSIYSRLTRNRAGVGSYTSLWLGPDHVMEVASSGYHERYNRVYLRDIQGLWITPSKSRFVIWMIALVLGLAGTAGVLLAEVGPLGVIGVVLLVATGVFALLALFLGRSCRVHVVTGVQTAEWTSVASRRKAGKVLEALLPLIEAAQGRAIPPLPAVPPLGESPAPAVPPPLT